MNRIVRQSVATATLLFCTAFMVQAPSAAQAAPIAVSAPVAQQGYAVGDLSFFGVRPLLESVGIGVEWIGGTPTNRLVLTAGDQRYEVIVDPATATANTTAGNFHYDYKEGRIALPLSFYTTVLADVMLNWDAATRTCTPQVAAGATVGLHHLKAYSAPVAAAPAVVETVAPAAPPVIFETGQATYYGAALHGNYTASGERFNMYDMTAAHKTLPFGTMVKVTNLNNGKTVTVKINDRGPFAPGRIIDLSSTAAAQVDMLSAGVVPVTLEIVQ